MNVNRITFYSMRNELHYKYHRDTLLLISNLSQQALDLIAMDVFLLAYRAAYSKEEEALDMIFKSDATKSIGKKDRSRDRIYTGFVATVKALLYHFDPAVNEAAERVLALFKHYGNVARKNYAEETAAIYDLLREMDRPKFTEDLKTMKVMHWRNRLEAENMAFESLTIQRIEDKATWYPIRMKDVRKETDQCYLHLVNHLEYLQIAGKSSPELLAFITELNVLVIEYKGILAHQHSKKTEEPEKPEPPKPEEPKPEEQI